MRTALDVMAGVFGAFFESANWNAWRTFLRALYALPMSDADLETFRACTGRQTPPAARARESWMVVGRRGGKSRIAAFLAVFLACFRRYRLAPGERGVVMVIAADRRQARVVMRYIRALLEHVEMLDALVTARRKESIDLSNGITIEVHTASFRTVRGYTVVAALLDEIAFWDTDEAAANPDSEILAALRPAMATVPDALLLGLSSPYARRGELWKAYQQHHGRDASPVLVWQAATRTMNPSVPQDVIDQAYADDDIAAAAEFGAEFRRDVEQFITREVLQAVVVPGRKQLPYTRAFQYQAFTDPAGGTGADSFTAAIAHLERDRVVVDHVLETRPPFSPEAVVTEFAGVLRGYGIARVMGDRYAGEWPREQFRKAGVEYVVAEQPKSDLYRDFLPIVTSQRVELLEHERLLAQLLRLERRTARSGKDSIDHPPRLHDDLANAVAGVVTKVGAASGGGGMVKLAGW